MNRRQFLKMTGVDVFQKRSGFVLICVLFFIAMLISLVLVMTLSMNAERIASSLYFHRIQAQVAAQEGVDHAKTLLTAYTSNSTLNWVSMPGKVMISENPKEKSQYDEKQLSSGVNVSGDDGDVWGPFNLNQERFNEERTPYLNPQTTQPLYLNWIYVRRDGTREISERPVHDPKNPLQARYAFWVDDESCRININQAWSSSTNNTNVLHHPSRADLRGLEGISEAQANEIHQNATNQPVISHKEYLRLTEGGREALSQNDYSITTRSHSAELNPWGEPKIVLTTQKNLANGRPYLDILKKDNTDPAVASKIDSLTTPLQGKYFTLSQKLMDYMRRTDWPCAPGKSFVQKYGEYGCLHIVADIIDYVRSAESSYSVVTPIYGEPKSLSGDKLYLNTKKNLGSSDVGTTYLQGSTARRPYVSEMGIELEDVFTSTVTRYISIRPYIKLYNPSLASMDIPTTNPTFAQNSVSVPNTSGVPNKNLRYTVITLHYGTNPLPPGQSATYKFTQTINLAFAPSVPAPTPPTNGSFTIFFQSTDPLTGVVDSWAAYTPMVQPTGILNWPIDPIGTPFNSLYSIKVGDPRLGNYPHAWTKSTQTYNSPTDFDLTPYLTYPRANSTYPTTPPSVDPAPQNFIPLQDNSPSGILSAASFTLPAPKGDPKNPYGVVQSVAELGCIPTQFTPEATIASPLPIVPWRTLRLQPTPSSENTIPDWALLDLFTVPTPYTSTNRTTDLVYHPLTNSVTGRVNVNAKANISEFSHQKTLEALLYGMTNIISRAETAQNIINFKTALNGVKRSPSNAYVSPHELCEIKGVADRGEASEEVMKTISALGAVRGNIFRIYSIGQSLQQASHGDLIVRSQKGIMTMVEKTSTNGVTVYIPRYGKQFSY